MKEWIEKQIHSFHRETENCEEFLTGQLDEQEAIESQTREDSQKMLQYIMNDRKVKLKLFAENCQSQWQKQLLEKQEEVHQKLAGYNTWKPWEATELYMKRQINKLSIQVAKEKHQRYKNLKQLRYRFEHTKKQWQREHDRRMSLVETALRKEGTIRGAHHVQAKRGGLEDLRTKYTTLQQEIQIWEDIKQRWSGLLEDRVSGRRNLVYDLQRARLPEVGSQELKTDRGESGKYKTAFLLHKKQIRANLTDIIADLDVQIVKYEIPLQKATIASDLSQMIATLTQEFGRPLPTPASSRSGYQ